MIEPGYDRKARCGKNNNIEGIRYAKKYFCWFKWRKL